jgi:hypothetical protein
MNDSRKWNAIRHKIEESSCVAVYSQEKKRTAIDISYLIVFVPVVSTSLPTSHLISGLLNVWNGSLFAGVATDINNFVVTVKLASLGQEWYLTNVYGPCAPGPNGDLTNWLYNFDAANYELWMLSGDFNLMRAPGNCDRTTSKGFYLPRSYQRIYDEAKKRKHNT